ncbi:MAG: MFS transporter [Hyphomicrobiales bacterium]|nr:MFS transporter [Hyphomicrobiales bacterium]
MVRSNRYILLLLTAILAVNFLDRYILSILLDAIGRDLSLTDTELGLLSGIFFAAVFVLFGFPVAKLAAKGNRRNIVAASALIWSALTITMGAAQNFAQLALARLGVGIGEAGAVAPSHSVITDLYPPERRTSALSTYVAGANAGILLAFLIGGLGGQAFGWRWAFVIAGIPGLVLAFLLRFTVAEPVREGVELSDTERRSLLLATLQTILADSGLVHAMIGVALTGVVAFGGLAWNPTFLIRAHHMTQAETGTFLALTVGIFGGLGTVFCGRLADRLGRRNARWRLGIVVIALLAAKPFVFAILLIEETVPVLLCFVVPAALASVFWGPSFAFLHSRVEAEMRPMATAIYLFAFNLIGMGIGPTLVGIMSDTVFSALAENSLRYALLVIQFAGIWGAWHYWRAMRTIEA